MEWLFVLGLLLFIAFIPLRNYLFGYKRKQRELRKIYKDEPQTQGHSGHKNHSGHSCC
jgi:hypothetical protein